MARRDGGDDSDDTGETKGGLLENKKSRQLHILFIIIQPPTSNPDHCFSPFSEENQKSSKRIGEEKREEGEKEISTSPAGTKTTITYDTPFHQLRVEFAERSRR